MLRRKHKKKLNIFTYENGEKKKLENLKKKHNQYIKSLGVNIDVDTGEIFSSFEGYDFPDLSCRPSLPTSDNIAGVELEKEIRYTGACW